MYKLLIVDDETANLRLLQRLFSQKYQCFTASSGVDAIQVLEQHDISVLITDQRMPEMSGIDLLKRTATLRPHMGRILLTGYTDVEALVEAINSGLVYMYVTKPWDNEDLKLKVNRALEHYEKNRTNNLLRLINERLEMRLIETRVGIVNCLSEMLKLRSKNAYERGLRIRHFSITIARALTVRENDKQDLAAAALLHELGDVVKGLAASGIQTHAECEAQLLFSLPELAGVADVLAGHQENFDGTGLPIGLKGDHIPQTARILRVAVSYDLMLNPKGDSPAMTHEEATTFLERGAGKQFDKKVVEALEVHGPDLGLVCATATSKASRHSYALRT